MSRVSRLASVLAALALLVLPAFAQEAPRSPTPGSVKLAARVNDVARGLEHPWGLAFLPDGRLVVTERPGRMRLVGKEGEISPPLRNVPAVVAARQGGLLDVALSPEFASSKLVYISYAEPRPGGGSATSVARARLSFEGDGGSLHDLKVIFRQEPASAGAQHFGSRFAFARDGNLFVTLGERYQPGKAQDLGTHYGKVVRIRADGSVPPDNPFVGRAGAKPEIWSYGHRNAQGAALHPQSGKLWMHEHGPRGGDEVNVAEAGKNYGWPVIGYGIDYSGARIHQSTHKEGMEQPVKYWVPSIAPSGMAFYTGDLIPAWRGHLFVGALVPGFLVRLEVSGATIGTEERLLARLDERIRDVRQGPDGYLYLLTDSSSGALIRLEPAR